MTAVVTSGLRARLLGGAALCAVAGVALIVWFAVLRDDEPTPGPLRADEGGVVGIPQEVGKPAVFSLAVAYNRGDQAAVIERIIPVGVPAGLRLEQSLVSGSGRKSNFSADYFWPSDEYSDLHRPAGFSVPPASTESGRNGVQFVFVFSGRAPGRYRFRGVEVDYRVGGTHHRMRVDSGFVACVRKPGTKRGSCPT